MASPETIAAQGTGNTGALGADTLFYVVTGKVNLSTDAGTTYIPFDQGEGLRVASGLTVHWQNPGTEPAVLNYMSV